MLQAPFQGPFLYARLSRRKTALSRIALGGRLSQTEKREGASTAHEGSVSRKTF